MSSKRCRKLQQELHNQHKISAETATGAEAVAEEIYSLETAQSEESETETAAETDAKETAAEEAAERKMEKWKWRLGDGGRGNVISKNYRWIRIKSRSSKRNKLSSGSNITSRSGSGGNVNGSRNKFSIRRGSRKSSSVIGISNKRKIRRSSSRSGLIVRSSSSGGKDTVDWSLIICFF